MADSTTPRQDAVEQNIQECIEKYGDENWVKLLAVCLQDIDVSLAMLVDK